MPRLAPFTSRCVDCLKGLWWSKSLVKLPQHRIINFMRPSAGLERVGNSFEVERNERNKV